ncbi:MAG TPA: AAA family ATPase, partial [Clostridia bacterium]|nr:AAA family ATPase [Clostridia bacterium]
MINRPTYVNKIIAFTDTPFVKILTGIRRSGKSTILKLIIEELKARGINDENIISYHFDSIENQDMTAKEIYALVKAKLSPDKKTYLFLDEVQEIPNWERVVNTLASEYNADIYVTGSNSRMMSSEISTYL